MPLYTAEQSRGIPGTAQGGDFLCCLQCACGSGHLPTGGGCQLGWTFYHLQVHSDRTRGCAARDSLSAVHSPIQGYWGLWNGDGRVLSQAIRGHLGTFQRSHVIVLWCHVRHPQEDAATSVPMGRGYTHSHLHIATLASKMGSCCLQLACALEESSPARPSIGPCSLPRQHWPLESHAQVPYQLFIVHKVP